LFVDFKTLQNNVVRIGDTECEMKEDIQSIGLISDTHGLLRRSVVESFSAVDMIIHAGDIDNLVVIEQLELTAPVHAVRGNMDVKPGVSALPDYIEIAVSRTKIGVRHIVNHKDAPPAGRNVSIFVYGHTHRACIEEISGILYVNPGSAGPARPGKPPSVAILELKEGKFVPRIIELPG
jgi:uncharacterized protein